MSTKFGERRFRMKRLFLLIIVPLIACASMSVKTDCPERYTSDCTIIGDQAGEAGSRIYTCADANECRQVIFVEGNENCEDGLYITDRWSRNEDGTCEPENPKNAVKWEPEDFPQYIIPEFVRMDVESSEHIILGGFVNDDGNVLIFTRRGAQECVALAYIAGMSHVIIMTCGEGMEVYQEICIVNGYCEEDPYNQTEGI